VNNIQPKFLFTSTLTLAIALLNSSAIAGEIVPSIETNTLVNQNGNLFTITGGELSSDSQNLFHKFPQFNLYLNEIIDFKTNPNLTNLVVGVNGGNPSFIDGLIRLTGSNANFLLLNPSGIAFGKNASIDLPADLYLSTANKVGFSNGQIFDILGANNYQNLMGNPESFIFDASQASGIINEGNLELKDAGNLSIVAGGIISTGTIDAGNVVIQAIPGSSKVKLTPKGSFVSYEIELPLDESGNLKSFTLYDIANILRDQGASNLHLEDGKITFLNQAVENNDLVTKDIKGESLFIESSNNAALVGGEIRVDNSAAFIAKNELFVRETVDNLFSIQTGGDLYLQGKNKIDILALDDLSRPPFISGGNLSFVSDGIISTDSHFLSGGSTSFFSTQNRPGNIQSLYDPIISANGNVEFGAYRGAALKVEATGSIYVDGNINIDAPDTALPAFFTGSDAEILRTSRAIILRAGLTTLENSDNLPQNGLGGGRGEPTTDFISAPTRSGYKDGALVINGTLNTTSQGNTDSSRDFPGGPIILETKGNGDIYIDELYAGFSEAVSGGDGSDVGDAGEVTINSGGSVIVQTTVQSFGEGRLSSNGSTITITANDSIDFKCSTCRSLNTNGTDNAGGIFLTATNGNINIAGNILATGNTTTGIGGITSLTANNGSISVSNITTNALNAGNIIFSSKTLNLNGNINASGSGSNGNITFQNDVILNESITITGGLLDFGGKIDAQDGLQSLTINTSENLDLSSTVGGNSSLDGLNITAPQVNIKQNLTTNGDIIFNAPVSIQNPLTINAQANKIFFNNILQSDNNALVLQANDLDFLGSVTGASTLNIQPFSLNRNINLGSDSVNTLSLSGTELSLINGFSQVAIGRNDGSGNIAITNNITFQDPLLFQTSTGSIIVDGNTTGIDDASITLNAPATFLNANLTSNNQDITINGNTTLEKNVTVDTGTGAGNIAFNGSITSQNQTLTTRSGLGETTLGNPVLVFDINLNKASNVNVAGDLSITNPNGNLAFNNPTTLTNNVNFTTAGGDITNNNTINSQTGTNFNLGINPTGGSFTNNAAIGGTQAVGNVVINNAQNVESNALIEVLSFTINNANKVTLNSDLIANGSAVDITVNNDITTTDITTNGGDINLVSNTGNILTGNLNSSNAGGTGGNVTAIALGNPNSTITTNNINSSGNVGGNVNLQAIQTVTTNEIFARGTVGNGGNVTIDPVNVVVNFIDAQGGAFGTGGNVDITATEFFRATGGFVDDTGIFSSISTTGGAGSGSITIRHAGGDLFVPFIVRDPSINGTAGALNTGAFTIAPYRVFPGSYYFGNISIITGDRFQNELNKATNIRIPELEPAVEIEDNGFFIDEYFTRLYERYFTDNPLADEQRIKSLDEIKDELAAVEEATGVKPALIYALFQPKLVREGCIEAEQVNSPDLITEVLEGDLESNEKESCLTNPLKFQEADDDILTLIMVTSNQPAKVAIVPSATRQEIEKYALKFSSQSRNSASEESRKTGDYYSNSQQIYDWLIAPLKEYFKQDEKNTKEISISNLTFITDSNLRSIPFAALVDSSQSDDLCKEGDIDSCAFLIEDYSVGLMPSMSLTDTTYQNLTSLHIRLGGAAKVSGHRRLRLMEKQLETIAGFWGENSENTLQGQDFTYENLQTRQEDREYGVIHLGTHAKFLGEKEPYIAFASKDVSSEQILLPSNLGLQDIRNIKLKGVNLLTLNACETALGDENAELGFAGFAHRAEARSVLGSLWLVSEHSTNALMLSFYREFFDSSSKDYTEGEEQAMPIKAESLRQAQLNLLTGKTRITDSQTMVFSPKLNPNIPNTIDITDYCQRYSSSCPSEFKDPYYWSGFTIIGSPW